MFINSTIDAATFIVESIVFDYILDCCLIEHYADSYWQQMTVTFSEQ